MHLSTVKIPVNFGLDWHCPSISFLISKPILHQPEKMLFASFLLYMLEWDHRFQVTPYAACVGWLASWKLRVVSLKYQYFDTVFRQWKCDRTITICVNAYGKRTVRTVLANMWHRFNNRRYRTRQQKTMNTGRNSAARTRPQHRPTFWHSSALGYFPSKFPPNQTLSES